MERIRNLGNHLICTGMPLTKAESQIYEYLVTDLNSKQIADKICKSHRTVKFHCHNVYVKLGINSRLELIVAHYEKLLSEKVAA